MKRKVLAQIIDHTQLKPEATPAQIRELCAEAQDHGFGAVCINPSYVPLAVKSLQGSDVEVCTVIGFPLGATTTSAKVCEAEIALAQGATELDMVLPIGHLKTGDHAVVENDIRAVAALCHAHDALLKVIIEAFLLTDDEKIAACTLAQRAGADFVKTSTGFAGGGATVEDVKLMRETVGPEMGVKAAGGIHTYDEAIAMIEAGATRIGASQGITIIQGART
jgi:deoxyribose-phosphate aldolase